MDYKTALSRASLFCARSEKSWHEIENKLYKWGVNSGDVVKILEYLKVNGFINERRYAESFVMDKFKFNIWGKTKISFMLKQKRIDENIINSVIDNIGDKEYFDTLYELLCNQKKSIGVLNIQQLKAKLYNFAMSRGFENDIIWSVIKQITEN